MKRLDSTTRPRRRQRPWRAALLLALACCVPAFAVSEGKPAPPMHARLLDGATFDLADNRGKVVLVNVWASWCTPCRQEMPALDSYYRQHRDQGLVLVALSMDDPRDAAKVRELTRDHAFGVGLARDADLAGYGRIWRLPVTFVVGRDGMLRKGPWFTDSGLDAQALEQTVTPLLQSP